MTDPNEAERLRAALMHIANGNLSPSIGFARRVLLGASVADAHAAEVAHMFNGVKPSCAVCYDMQKVPRRDAFIDCPTCSRKPPTAPRS